MTLPLTGLRLMRVKCCVCREDFLTKRRKNPTRVCSKSCRNKHDREYLRAYRAKVKRGAHVVREQPHPPDYYAASFEEIAAEIGTSSARVQQIQASALKKLRKRLAFLFRQDLRRASDRDLVTMIFR